MEWRRGESTGWEECKTHQSSHGQYGKTDICRAIDDDNIQINNKIDNKIDYKVDNKVEHKIEYNIDTILAYIPLIEGEGRKKNGVEFDMIEKNMIKWNRIEYDTIE